MDFRLAATVFTAVFLAELGDKTQLSTMLFASSPGRSPWTVFTAASLALVTATALGVFVGHVVGARINSQLLARVAGLAFIAIGIWTLLRA